MTTALFIVFVLGSQFPTLKGCAPDHHGHGKHAPATSRKPARIKYVYKCKFFTLPRIERFASSVIQVMVGAKKKYQAPRLVAGVRK